MKKKIVEIFVVGILIIAGFASIPTRAGPALEPLTSPDSQIIDMIEQVNESLIYYYTTHLTAFGPHYTGTENSIKVSQYIYDEFQTMGLSVEFHNWNFNDFTDRNVVATLPGTDTASNAIFIISAHHDTIATSPGALDDGSGVAAVLATAKILSQYSFNYTIQFISFSGEEVGSYGSYMYARDASQRGDNIVAIINLDWIGYANTTEGGRNLLFLCTERTQWIGDFVKTVGTFYRNQTNMTVDVLMNSGSSDQQSFFEYGFDAVQVVEYDLPYDSWWHTQNDTIDKINLTYLAKVTKLLLGVVAEIASTPIELQVIITKPYEGYFYFYNKPLFSLVFKNRNLGLRGTTIIIGVANTNVNVIPYNDVKYVYFVIDRNGFWWDMQYGAAPQYESKIIHAAIGKHVLEIYACDTSGKVASDEMDVFLFM